MSLTPEQLHALYSVARMQDNSMEAFIRTYQCIDKHNRSISSTDPTEAQQDSNMTLSNAVPDNTDISRRVVFSGDESSSSSKASSVSDELCSDEDEFSDSSFVQSSVADASEADHHNVPQTSELATDSFQQDRDEVDLVSNREQEVSSQPDAISDSARNSPIASNHDESSDESFASSPRD